MDDRLRRTPLYENHRELGARMVPFAGWEMPIQYEGILAEHQIVRTAAGLFDVSHMGEVDFVGPRALATVQRLTTNDANRLTPGQAQYTLLCHPEGGIVDDCILYRLDLEHYRLVINAANLEKDVAHMRSQLQPGDPLEDRSSAWALLAVQGPDAVGLVAGLASEAGLAELPSFGVRPAEVAGVPVLVARTGYTGEDGFELFVAPRDATSLWKALLAAGARPVGLGARDTLRLEARLPLYGNDLDDTTNPYEAGLGWTVKLAKGDFVGRAALEAIKARGPTRKLVGFVVQDRGIVRSGAEVVDDAGRVIGTVRSGGPAPTVGGAVGLAYVPAEHARAGNLLRFSQRGKTLAGRIVDGPFYRRQDRT